MRQLAHILLGVFSSLVLDKPMSALTPDQQRTATLHAIHRNRSLSVDAAARDLGIGRAHAEELLTALFDAGTLSQRMRRGVLHYEYAR